MTTTHIGRGLFSEHAPPDKRIELAPTARQVRWLRLINLHGSLPSTYLFELEGNKTDAERRAAQHQLTRLWRSGFVFRPRQQRATDNANYHDYVYDLSEKGKAYLKENGAWIEACRPTGNFVHQLMVSCITATIHIHCEREGYRYIPPHEYLAGRDATVKVSFEWDRKRHELPLCPDALFAIDYGDNSFIAYALEADRNTEPNTSKLPNRKSDVRTIRQYAELIGKKRYKQAYGRDAMIVLLYITVNQIHAENFIELVRENAGAPAYIAAGVVPEFETPFRPPKLLTHLFEEPLLRAKTKRVMQKFRHKKTGEIVEREKPLPDGFSIKKTT